MSEKKRQLLMRRDMTKPLTELPKLPEQFTIAAGDAECAREWEWVIAGAFPEWKPTFDLILNDERCAPERVFYVREYGHPCSTTAVQLEEHRAVIHMVGTHPYTAGMNLGSYAVNAALECVLENGKKIAELTTDDHRLAAVKTYLALGFEPVIEDEEMETRWKAVLSQLTEEKGSRKPKVLPLWPEGEVPYWQEGNCVPAIEAYPVEGSKGAVVVCPGGAYCMKASHEGRQIARMLNGANISAYVLDYRVRPCHYEAPLSDAKRAIRTVRSMGYEKVAIMGFSAGGHLTCSAATQYDMGDANAADPIERLSSRPDAFIPCYPVVSFTAFSHHGSIVALLGDQASDFSLRKRFSAELNVTADTPTAFIWHTVTDAGVPVENSISLGSALAHAGVPFEMHLFPSGGHGMGLAAKHPVACIWPELCQKWLTGLGFAKE